MDSTLKQRLVGAVVMIALAVIFVPMFLGGPVQRTRVDIAVEMPAPPDVPPAAAVPPKDMLEQPSPGASLANVPEPVEVPDAAPPPPPPPAHVAGAGEGPMPAPVAEPEAPEVSAPPPELVATPEPEPEPAPPAEPAPDPELAAWAVQVGAFGKQGNAMGLRERLRNAGFPAYVDRVPGNSGVLHRVRLGPVASRAEAESLAARAQQQADLQGIIVSR